MGASSAAFVREGDMIAGKYRVERVLGQGAMGLVTAAMHVDLHERRAIKFMLPDCVDDPEFVERFMREARACARLKSRHVASVYDVGRLENGAPYIVMEYLHGADLKTVLRDRKVLPIHEAVDYMLQACEAVGEAHQAGIVHRDIKLANMFLAAGVGGAPCIKVLDFGIAKLVRPPDAGPDHHDMTTTNVVMGSPLYMSPEQMRSSRHVDARADIWSLGVVLYALVTGSLPFRAETTIELCSLILTSSPRRPSDINPRIPQELDFIILRCLEKEAANRWLQVADLANALRPYAVPQAASAGTALDAQGGVPAQRASAPSYPHISGAGPFSPPSTMSSASLSSMPFPIAGSSSPSSLIPSSRPIPAGAPGTYGQGASYVAASTSSSADLSPHRLGDSVGGQTGGTWAQTSRMAQPPARSSRAIALGAAVVGTLVSAGVTLFILLRSTGPANAPDVHAPVIGQEGTAAAAAQQPEQAPEVMPVPTQSAAAPVTSASSSPPAQDPLSKPPPPVATPKVVSPPATPSQKSKQKDAADPFGKSRQ